MENIIFIDTKEEFKKGTTENLDVNILANIDESFLSIKNTNLEGTFISREFKTDKFKRLIVSWNSETPGDTYLEVAARVYVEGYSDGWSGWLSWGKWGTEIQRASSNTELEIAKINTDELIIKGDKEVYGSKIQIRVKLNSNTSEKTPKLYSIVASYLKQAQGNDESEILNDDKDIIKVPKISQYLREPSIANSICSPTSITMLLNRMEENLVVEDVAWKVYDYKYEGFGNWTYNTAYAGSRGYKAFVEYGSIASIRRELKKGYPIAVSVKYTNDIWNIKLPFIKNAPTTTYGHLIVVCGIEKDIKGDDYVVVNDPAGKTEDCVTLRYELQSFLKAWKASNNIMYVVNKK